jgi:chemotaxis protein MotB
MLCKNNMKKNRDLLEQLDEKGKALALEQVRLSKAHNVCKN